MRFPPVSRPKIAVPRCREVGEFGLNLFDIVRRKDRCLRIEAGDVTPVHRAGPWPYFGVSLAPGSRFRLVEAHTFTAFQGFPRAPGWLSLAGHGHRSGALDIELEAQDGRRHLVYASSAHRMPEGLVTLDWPVWAGLVEGFDLVFDNTGDEACDVATTWVFNPRLNLRPLVRGDGIEVGPGVNPFVKADADTRVRYVEAAPIEEWITNYGKTLDQESIKPMWDSYIIGDAITLEMIADASLDFIFSSHVFEHLHNPIGVLENWSRKLKPGGFVAAVIPDLRYCFDLRQPPSTLEDWRSEYATGGWQLTAAKYEKWCRYTAPYATPESLIARNYSIHAHYYTSETILQLVGDVRRRGFYDQYFLNAAPNNKDFAIALRAA